MAGSTQSAIYGCAGMFGGCGSHWIRHFAAACVDGDWVDVGCCLRALRSIRVGWFASNVHPSHGCTVLPNQSSRWATTSGDSMGGHIVLRMHTPAEYGLLQALPRCCLWQRWERLVTWNCTGPNYAGAWNGRGVC